MKHILSILAAVALLADATPGQAQSTRLKELHLDTMLIRDGSAAAAIVAPANGRYGESVALLQSAFRAAGKSELPIIAAEDADPETLLRDRSLIVLGNMNTSACMYTLYRQWFTFLDLRHPGKNGWEVRSLHNPHGTGHNVILLGGSDDNGVSRAARDFAGRLKPANPLKVGWLLEVHLGDDGPKPPEPGKPLHSWRDGRRADTTPSGGGRGTFGLNVINEQAILYYTTGEKKYLDEFLRLALPDPNALPPEIKSMKVETAMRDHEMPEFGITRPLRLAHHYWTHVSPMIWDLIEESPLLTDEIRLKITSDLEANHDFMAKAQRIDTSRHGLYHGLCALTYSRYFNRSYPAPKWDKRLKEAHDAFQWWTRHPMYGERDTVMFMNTSVQPVVEYFLLTDPRPFVESGVAATLMKSLEILWSGRPVEESNMNQTINFMHRASYLLNDGRYAFMASRSNYDFSVFRIEQSWWPGPGLEVKPPTDSIGRINVMPLAEPHGKGLPFGYKEGYNFLSYRTGFGPNDGYLFLDGFRDVGRLPYHVSALARLRNTGRDLLAGYGSQFVVLSEGLSGARVPQAAALERTTSLDGMAYVRTAVPDARDATWHRHILWVDDAYTLIADGITARSDGRFDLVAKWEPVESMRASPVDPRWAQSAGPNKVTIVSAQPVLLRHSPTPQQFDNALTPPNFDLMGLLEQELAVDLKRGERAAIFNAIYGDDGAGRFVYRLEAVGDSAVTVHGKAEGVFLTAPLTSPLLQTDAEALFLSGDTIFLVRGTNLGTPDRILKSDTPLSLRWRSSRQTLLVETDRENRLELKLPRDARLTLDGRPASVEWRDGFCSLRLPPGRHEIGGVSFGAEARLAESVSKMKRSPTSVPRPIVPDAKASMVAAWKPRWELQLGGEITHVKSVAVRESGSETWVATKAPALHRVSSGGALLQTIPLTSPVDVLEVADVPRIEGGVLILAGCRDNRLRAFSGAGKLLWAAESKVSPAHYTGMNYDANWFSDPAKITGIRSLLVCDLTRSGTPEIILGRPSTLEYWSLDGTLIKRDPIRWGECSRLALVEDAAGPRVLLGSFYCTEDSVKAFDAQRQPVGGRNPQLYLKAHAPGATDMKPANFQRGVAELRVADLDGDGNQEVIVARSGHWNDVRVYASGGTKCHWQEGFGPAIPRLGQEATGRFIRALAIGGPDGNGRRQLSVALSNGWVFCFDHQGRSVWRHRFSTVPLNVLESKEGWAVALQNGEVVLIDREGNPRRRRQQPGFSILANGTDAALGPMIGDVEGRLVALER